jgi:hypothetical protein
MTIMATPSKYQKPIIWLFWITVGLGVVAVVGKSL